MAKLLYTIREHCDLSAAVWQQFRDRAAQNGHSPTDALARLVRRYLEKGFEDGHPEEPPTPHSSSG
jgi:hypothetical protein